jgi:hypothetical protein
MGQANERGTRDERVTQAVQARTFEMLEGSEVLIGLSADAAGVSIKCLPRDAEPNQESEAVIVAAFINANFGSLVQTAMQAKKDFEAAQAAGQPNPHMIKQQPQRSITSVDGGLAKDAPAIVGPDGKPLQ